MSHLVGATSSWSCVTHTKKKWPDLGIAIDRGQTWNGKSHETWDFVRLCETETLRDGDFVRLDETNEILWDLVRLKENNGFFWKFPFVSSSLNTVPSIYINLRLPASFAFKIPPSFFDLLFVSVTVVQCTFPQRSHIESFFMVDDSKLEAKPPHHFTLSLC